MKLDKLPTLTQIIAGLAYLSVCFHLGYFQTIGIEFISAVGSSNILTSFAFLSSVIIVMIGLYFFVSALIARLALQRIWHEIILWSLYTLVLVLTVTVLAVGSGSDPNWLELLSQINIGAWLLLLTVFTVSDASKSFVRGEEVELRSLFMVALFSGMLMMTSGWIYATYAGAACEIVMVDNAVNGHYLLTLEGGHLVKLGDRTVFINADSLIQVSCQQARGAFEPSAGE